MYNEELKNKFLQDSSYKPKYLESIEYTLKCTEKYEEKAGKDLCAFNKDELVDMLNSMAFPKTLSFVNRLSHIRNYKAWCVKNGIDGAVDDSDGINATDIVSVKIYTVNSPAELQAYLDSFLPLVEEQTVDNTYRAFLWLAFSGINEQDSVKITPDNINFNSMLISYNGYDYPIYDESVDALKSCIEDARFVYNHKNFSVVVYREREDGDNILRGTKSKNPDRLLKKLSIELSRKQKKALKAGRIKKNLNYRKVAASGVFYRAYQHEQKGYSHSFIELAEKRITEREAIGKPYNLSSGRATMDAKKRQLVRQYEKDYERWKLTL